MEFCCEYACSGRKRKWMFVKMRYSRFIFLFQFFTQEKHTSATKKRATTFEDLIAADCIQVFLTAIRSAKWFVAERIPMKTSMGPLGNGWDFHFSDISNTHWSEKLGWETGREVAYTEWISTSPLIANPVASSRVNP